MLLSVIWQWDYGETLLPRKSREGTEKEIENINKQDADCGVSFLLFWILICIWKCSPFMRKDLTHIQLGQLA